MQDIMGKSYLCKRKDFNSPFFVDACSEMGKDININLKTWELCSIYKSLKDRGCIEEGKIGLGFGVGKEPLPAIFAKHGCKIVATDLEPNSPRRSYWNTLGFTGEHHPVTTRQNLNPDNICDQMLFNKNVSIKYVDMNYIYSSLFNSFDFTWSTSSLEHIGGLSNALSFLRTQMKCLKVGGWSVHATAYNVGSNDETVDTHNMCFLRKKDIERLSLDLKEDGNYLEAFDCSIGTEPDDLLEVEPPYDEPAINVKMLGHLMTSVILIAQRRR